MSNAPLMPMATAVWLVENTTLTFKQIANFCNLHEVEVQGIADGEVAKGIVAYNPIISGQLTREEIETSSNDKDRPLKINNTDIKISNIKNVLEIGTFTGLSALSIALALPDDGKLTALDKNEETNKIATEFFKKANQDNKIQTIVKPALESLDDLKNSKFDMIFIDADKMNYKEYYEKSLNLLSKNGLIIIDNVLWYGEVADETNLDKYTLNIREFNNYVLQDKRVEQIIVPLGDGMTVCRVL